MHVSQGMTAIVRVLIALGFTILVLIAVVASLLLYRHGKTVGAKIESEKENTCLKEKEANKKTGPIRDPNSISDPTTHLTVGAGRIEDETAVATGELCKVMYQTEDLLGAKLPALYQKPYLIRKALTPEQCEWIIYHSERTASKRGGWDTLRHTTYPTIDLPINDIPEIRFFIENLTFRVIIPEVETKYGLEKNRLGIYDPFIIKYTAESQSMLEPHQDYAEFSYVIVLNKDFEGGGTRFTHLNMEPKTEIGDIMLFCGRNQHMGIKITDGVRYVIAGFLHYGNKESDEGHTCKNRF